uniref:ABC transmembrane type-2 domain-containing protein n=1 Tax=Acrochaetium secundatum TaxID=209631 RepID=A0A4D6BKG7_9FLOR|nr:hypothetical protein [Acrochaetium secundatum]QBX88391.1 hypothetical protein [Acrochaetium secundatum]
MHHNSNNTSTLNPNLYPRIITHKSIILSLTEICALNRRLILQGWRRPSTFVTGILQPLLWLILFSALFQNAPIDLLSSNNRYNNFISAGIIVFTAFTCSLNAGLPLMFDREFGFLNRLLSSPLSSRYSIIYSSSSYITITSIVQVASIILTTNFMGNCIPNLKNGVVIAWTLLLLIHSVTNISLLLAFILPGHIELIACLVMINLPLLFSSTALAPLLFMPSWLQVIASLNPLSYTIEVIRYAYLHEFCYNSSIAMQTVWGSIRIIDTYTLMIILNIVCLIVVKKVIDNRFDE